MDKGWAQKDKKNRAQPGFEPGTCHIFDTQYLGSEPLVVVSGLFLRKVKGMAYEATIIRLDH